MQVLEKGVERRSITRAVSIRAGVAHVWHCLTTTQAIEQWFADVKGSYEVGATCEMHFGDGDFFEVTTLAAVPMISLRWSWRFWGVGGLSDIEFLLAAEDDSCRVTVVDAGEYSERGVSELEEGWDDFLGRLRSYAETGKNARYRWSESIGAAMVSHRSPLELWEIVGEPQWWERGFPTYSVELTANEDDLVARFCSGAWGGASTTAVMSVVRRLDGVALSVQHGGWLSLPSTVQFEERRTVALLWAKALRELEQAR
ncbi:hypothetical protein F183_A28120 [Bryobacterales bacterium F-183]|nr:hypothetical protein F183_A28120 [Bryobacterales bacterium F-183]